LSEKKKQDFIENNSTEKTVSRKEVYKLDEDDTCVNVRIRYFEF